MRNNASIFVIAVIIFCVWVFRLLLSVLISLVRVKLGCTDPGIDLFFPNLNKESTILNAVFWGLKHENQD